MGRLAFALANCPPRASRNRRRILTYLVPCRMRLGHLPSLDLLRRHGLENFSGLARAVATGDVVLFNSELAKEELWLIRVGTYLVVEKLKLMVYQKLCMQVYHLVSVELEQAGKTEKRHQQDLRRYERAFAWQDEGDGSETVCILANLMYIGAIRGYLSDEHRKIVFSKESPFPSPANWSGKT